MTRALALALTLSACAIDLAPLPVPRVRATPTAIAEGDGYATDVTLDARASRDEFGDPPAALSYAWRLDGSARIEGDAQGAVIHARFAGDRPPAATLTVRTPDGREASVTYRVALTTR